MLIQVLPELQTTRTFKASHTFNDVILPIFLREINYKSNHRKWNVQWDFKERSWRKQYVKHATFALLNNSVVV